MKTTLGNPFPGVPPFRPGDEVQIVGGAFVEYRGVVELVRTGVLRVVINVFGRETRVDVGVGDVRKV